MAEVCKAQTVHRTLLSRKVQKPTFLRGFALDAINQAAEREATNAGY